MNLQRFDDSTLIRNSALQELHRLKERGLTRGRFSIITAAINSLLSGAFPAGIPQTWPVCG